MKCMYCGCIDSKVIDSRLIEDGTAIRRRRECVGCGRRFTTYETVETTPIMVVKRSGNRQQFSSDKVKNGVMKACEKRPIPMYKIEKLVADVEKEVTTHAADQEISSDYIGDLIMAGLKEIDDVAYVRYAAVHRRFADIGSWHDEIEKIINDKDKSERD